MLASTSFPLLACGACSPRLQLVVGSATIAAPARARRQSHKPSESHRAQEKSKSLERRSTALPSGAGDKVLFHTAVCVAKPRVRASHPFRER